VQARRSTEKARRRLIGWGLTLPILVLAASSAGAAGEPLFLTLPLPADSLLADGAPVVELDFSGTEVRSPLALDRVVRSTAPASGRPWSGRALDRVLGAILDSYRDIGHLHAAITLVEVIEVEGGLRLEFLIDEGPPVLLGEIDITGNDLYDDATIRHLLGLDEGAPFVPDRFHEGIERLLDRYENEGRPFAQVEPRDLIWDDEVRFTLAVREGRPVSVDAIQVSGNRVTRSSVVERISGLELGEPFAQVRIEQADRADRARPGSRPDADRGPDSRARGPDQLRQRRDRLRG
jgi:hypothetical protein